MEKSECETKITSCANNWEESYTLNAYIYFCCERCQVRTMCGDQVTAYQLTNAGLLNIGHGCIIKTDNFTVYPHKPHWSELKTQPEIYIPIMAPINHIINITIPLTHLPEGNESQEMQKDLIEIGEKINNLKEAEVPSEDLSYHNIHHYAMIYVILGVAVLIGISRMLRRVRCSWRVPRSSPPDTEGPATDAAAPGPRATPRAIAAGRTNEQHNHDNSDGAEEHLRVDRGTSPAFRAVSFN